MSTTLKMHHDGTTCACTLTIQITSMMTGHNEFFEDAAEVDTTYREHDTRGNCLRPEKLILKMSTLKYLDHVATTSQCEYVISINAAIAEKDHSELLLNYLF